MFLNWEITDHRWVWPCPSPSLAKGEGQRTFTPYLPPYIDIVFKGDEKSNHAVPDWSNSFLPGQGRGKEKLARKSDWRKEQRLLGIRDTAQMHTEDKSGHILAEKNRPNKFQGTFETLEMHNWQMSVGTLKTRCLLKPVIDSSQL